MVILQNIVTYAASSPQFLVYIYNVKLCICYTYDYFKWLFQSRKQKQKQNCILFEQTKHYKNRD